MNSANVGSVRSVPSASVTEYVDLLVYASKAKIMVAVPSILSPFEIIRTVSSSSSGVLSVPCVDNRDSASAAWCLTPARCSRPKSNSDRPSSHHASLLVASAEFKIHRSES